MSLASAPLLEARRLGRQRPDGGWLLAEISLSLVAGERLAVVGPSGAGKSLLLRALALLDAAEAGEILFRGENIADEAVPAFRRQVVYFHQRPALFDGSVEDNLRKPFELQAHRDGGFDRDRALKLLETIGRGESFLELRAANLSGGEAQLTALVRALQLEPSVLLLDEPTAALDAEATASVEQLLARWLDSRPEAAMVWVGHDRSQVARMTSRAIQLRDGRIEGAAP